MISCFIYWLVVFLIPTTPLQDCSPKGTVMACQDISGDRIVSDIEGTLPRILATVRTLESGGDYKAQAKGSSASGAYQHIDSTWRAWALSVPGASIYLHAKDAPPEIQDKVSANMARSYLTTHGNHLAAVPIMWYYPIAWNNCKILDSVPAPSAGNTMTVRGYAERWLRTFDKTMGTGGVGAGEGASGLPNPLPWIAGPVGGWLFGDNPITSTVDFLKMLGQKQTWIRLIEILGGFTMILLGLSMLAKSFGIDMPKVPGLPG